MLAVLGSARVTDIAWKFIRLVGMLTLAMGCVATALVFRDLRANIVGSTWWWVVAGGIVLVLGAIALVGAAPLVARVPSAIRAVSFFAGCSGVIASILTSTLAVESMNQGFLALAIVGQTISSWMLGSITVAWLLGHAYLTATRMTIAPLRYFSKMLSASVATRLVFFAATLGAAGILQSPESASLWTQLEKWWIIVLLRVGVGLVAVAVFAYMVRDCVRLRSTQSATGILYFASLMAYVGELASQYLTRELGWPL